MRRVTVAILIVVVCIGRVEFGSAQVKITGGGEYRDRKGIHVRPNSTFPSLVRLSEGTLLCYDMASHDGGQTWSRYQEFTFPLSDAGKPRRGAIAMLKDGTVLLMGRYTQKHERDADVYVAEIYRSRNDFAGYTGPKRALIHIPNVVAGTDEYGMPVSGPFLGQSIVELPGGDLLACMWGWFESDTTPSGYPDRWEKWSSGSRAPCSFAPATELMPGIMCPRSRMIRTRARKVSACHAWDCCPMATCCASCATASGSSAIGLISRVSSHLPS